MDGEGDMKKVFVVELNTEAIMTFKTKHLTRCSIVTWHKITRTQKHVKAV